MRAKILEDFIIMSRLLRSFSRISFRSNSSSSTSSRNSNLLNDQDNQTQEVAPKHNLFDEEVRFEDINQSMDDWNIPEIPHQLCVPETMKDKHNFDYIIKTVENNLTSSNKTNSSTSTIRIMQLTRRQMTSLNKYDGT